MSIYSRNEEFLKKRRFSKGNRVYLTKTPTYERPCNHFPLKGSKFERLGTIAVIGREICEVHWDNGTTSIVPYVSLEHAAKEQEACKTNPNLMWKYRGK